MLIIYQSFVNFIVFLGSETSALTELIKKGACVNVVDSRNQTPLMQAIISSSNDKLLVIKLLITAGADTKAFNNYSNTALLMANAHHDNVCIKIM